MRPSAHGGRLGVIDIVDLLQSCRLGVARLPSSARALAIIVLALHTAAADDIVAARLDPPDVDHPAVFAREPVRGAFHLENTGTRSFRIVQAKSTCSCTTAVMSEGAIRPGEKAEIGYEMHSAVGTRRTVSIYVQTNPPLAEPLIFKASASWKPLLEVDPVDLHIRSELGKAIERHVPIRAAEGAGAVKITGATTRQKGYELSLETPPAGQDALAILVVRSTDDLPPGNRALRVSLAYERGEAGTQDITFEQNIHSDFVVSPSPLVIPIESGAAPPSISFSIRNAKGLPFTIESIRSERFTVRRPSLSPVPAAEQQAAFSVDFGSDPIPRHGFLFLDLDKGSGILTVDVYFNPARPRE